MKLIIVLLALLAVTCGEGNETQSSTYKSSTKLGLVMIVGNDMGVLPRIIASVKDYVHTFMVCDIGSNDGTHEYLKNLFSERGTLRGAVLRHNFEDFSTNKNLCLQAAESLDPPMDYFLVPESDYELVVKSPTWLDEIQNDYNLVGIEGNLFYRAGILVSSRKGFRFQGRTYEVLKSSKGPQEEFTRSDFNGISFVNHGDSPRRLNRGKEDVKLLSLDLQENPDNARTVFNLARVYESLQMYDSALKHYQQRIQMSGWYEEVWYSMYKVGVCKVMRNDDFDSYVNDFLEAYDALMTRAEPLFWLARLARTRRRYGLCLMFGLQGMAIQDPSEHHHLFIEKPVYEWQLKDEVSQCLGWRGGFTEAKRLIKELLEIDSIPKENKEMIKANLKWCEDKIKEQKVLEKKAREPQKPITSHQEL